MGQGRAACLHVPHDVMQAHPPALLLCRCMVLGKGPSWWLRFSAQTAAWPAWTSARSAGWDTASATTAWMWSWPAWELPAPRCLKRSLPRAAAAPERCLRRDQRPGCTGCSWKPGRGPRAAHMRPTPGVLALVHVRVDCHLHNMWDVRHSKAGLQFGGGKQCQLDGSCRDIGGGRVGGRSHEAEAPASSTSLPVLLLAPKMSAASALLARLRTLTEVAEVVTAPTPAGAAPACAERAAVCCRAGRHLLLAVLP